MSNRFYSIVTILLSAVLCSCDSGESQLHTSLSEVMKIERGLHYFYECGGADSISQEMAANKARQIARIEALATGNGVKLGVEIDTVRVNNHASLALIDRLYRAKAAEEYLVGVSYVELESDLKEVEGMDAFLSEGVTASQQNIDKLSSIIKSVE